MLLINEANFKVDSSSRLVKATDVAAVRTADEVLSTAKAEAERIRSSAQEAYEEERKRGFAQGMQEWREKSIADKLNFAFQSASYMEKVESKLVDVVMKAVQKCVSQVDDKTIVMDIVHKLMKAVILNQRQVILKVAPPMVPVVRAHLNEVLVDYPALDHVDIKDDPRLKGSAAVIETEAGIADASIETQIAAIETAIRKHFARGADKDDGRI